MAGSSKVTASGILGTSGKPVRVFNVVLASTSGGSGVANLRNGSVVTDSLVDIVQAEADSVSTKNYGAGGKYFPAGLYIELGANVLHVDIDWELISIA